jgi:hypothetical protein
MCRKLHASAFRTRANLATRDWNTLTGAEIIKFYESSKGEHKAFALNADQAYLLNLIINLKY